MIVWKIIYKTIFVLLIFSHAGDSVSLEGVWELGSIFCKLPDGPGGFTCLRTYCQVSVPFFLFFFRNCS